MVSIAGRVFKTVSMNTFFLLLSLFAATKSPVIHYRQLTWEDFKGKPPVGTEAMACTCTNIVIGMDTAYAIFIPEKSWTKTKDAALLRHEQLHFTITALYAKWISEDMKDKNIHQASEDLFDNWRSMEKMYDRETNHGTDTVAQKEWEEKIKP